MAQRMLIDATHPEETRVAVVSGNRLEDIDYETSTKQQLKGNIYLAKVVRVEPSLQACFVDYGGNRHGFLAFSEIHPDYYRIPVSDREALLAEQAAAARAEEEEEDRRDREGGRRGRGPRSDDDGQGDDGQGDDGQGDDGQGDDDSQGEGGPESLATPIEVTEVGGFEPATIDASPDATATRAPAEPEPAPPSAPGESTPAWTPTEWAIATRAPADEAAGEPAAGSAALRMTMPETSAEAIWPADESAPAAGARAQGETAQPAAGEGAPGEAPVAGDLEARQADEPAALQEARTAGRVETVGGDAADEVPRRPRRQFRSYKIQEVIKRRQIMLVQVVKEERGNKGAALTTYLSLAGRYCVLMPNTTRGGGVSRKITSAQDRRRLKTLLEDLELPQGMAVIVRTAGSERSKAEVKRDCDYLLRLWDEIREMTLKSTAPCLIYEEASLIKRAIRDLYARDIDEVLVEGDDGYRAAKDFMKMLMPSHAKRVQPYRDEIPLFHRFQIETQIDAMHSPVVQLKSGGYVVINPTEALVAIDVNSGRATRERFIEETALRTNLEAAEEVARQLRLRDLGGLIVIDFIDMEDHRNNHAVERRLKDALRFDRARIQVGRISPFGLLELSRQRLRPSITETSTMPCPHCNGTGLIRSTESAALHVLRAIEEEGIRRRSREIVVHVATPVALYILNQKRARLAEVEQRYGLYVTVSADELLIPPDYRLERVRSAAAGEIAAPVRAETVLPTMGEEPEEQDEMEAEGEAAPEEAEAEVEAEMSQGRERAPERREAFGDGEEGDGNRRRRRRRGRHRRRDGEDREGPRREGPGREGPGREGPGREGPGREGLARESQGREGPGRDQRERFAGAPQPQAEFVPAEHLHQPFDGSGEQPTVDGPLSADEIAQPGRPFAEGPAGEEGEGGEARPRRRRGRRGGRRRGRREGGPEGGPELAPRGAGEDRGGPEDAEPPMRDDTPAWPHDASEQELPPPPARTQPWPLSPIEQAPAPEPLSAPEPAPAAAAAPAEASPAPAEPSAPAGREHRASVPANVIVVDETTPKPAAGRRGWWQRLTQG